MDVNGVESTRLEFDAGLLTVQYDAADVAPRDMILALEAAGYGATLPGS